MDIDLSPQILDAASKLADCVEEDLSATIRENLHLLLRTAIDLGQDPALIDLSESIASVASSLAVDTDPETSKAHRKNLQFLVELAGRAQEAAGPTRGGGKANHADSDEDLLTTTAAAELLGISRPTVMRLIEQGQLDHVMVGSHHRIPSPSVLEYKERRLVSRERVAAVDERGAEQPVSAYRRTVSFGQGGDVL
jgi:excisionase family DNA binding protein